MTLNKRRHKGLRSITLSDGTNVSPGETIGSMHLIRAIPRLQQTDSLLAFSLDLFRSARESFQELAALCANNDPRLKEITIFGGPSHLAGKLAERMGFETFPINNVIERRMHKLAGRIIVQRITSKNQDWQRFRDNFRDPRDAFITRKRLLELYH